MKSDLRGNPQHSMGRYWLTMSDATAFTLIQTSVSIAETLRCELAEKSQVLASHGAAEIAVSMLTAAEGGWGKGKAIHLVALIVDVKKQSSLKKANVYALVRSAMAQLPLTLWPQEKLPARHELLEELNRQACGAQTDVPQLPTRAEQKERQWRDAIAAQRTAELRHR